MASQSSTLAWKIPWEEPGRLQSMDRKELDTTEQLNKKLTITSQVTLGKSFNSHGLVSSSDEWEYTNLPCPSHRQVVRVSHKKMHKNVFEGVKRALYTMCKYNVHKTIPVFNKVLRKLQSNYKKQTFEEILLMADVLNGKLNDKFRRFISDYDEYCKVYDIVLENKKLHKTKVI